MSRTRISVTGQLYSLLCVSSNGSFYFMTANHVCSGLTDFANTDLTSTAAPGDRPRSAPAALE